MGIDGKKLQFWSDHFDRWRASGLTLRAYCAREGLALSTFGHWRRQVSKELRREPVHEPAPRTGPLTLVPAQLEGRGDVHLHSPAGWRITLPSTLERDTLAHLLSALP